MLSHQIPKFRSAGVIAAGLSLVLIFISIAHPIPRARLSQVYHSSSNDRTRTGRSAWFSEQGYLRLDTVNGWGTQYEVRDHSEVYTCDVTTTSVRGTRTCINKIRLLLALRENSAAREEALRRAEDGEREGDEEIEGEVQRSAEETRALRGKRILYLGDSVDRFPIDELHDILPTSDLTVLDPRNGLVIPRSLDPETLTPPHKPHTTMFFNVRLIRPTTSSTARSQSYHPSQSLHADDFRIDFLFTFGLFHFPSAEAYMAHVALLEPIVGASATYDAIVLNAGLWDLEELMKAQDERVAGVKPEAVDQFVDRFIDTIALLRAKFGSIPIAIRLVHDVQHEFDAIKFRAPRPEHLRQAQLEVARRTGAHVLPFGTLMRSQPFFYIPDGVHPTPEANMVHLETLLRLVEEVT